MKAFRRSTRIFILCLLVVSVFAPIFLLSDRLTHIKSDVSKKHVEDLSIIKHRTEAQTFSALEQEEGEGLKEPLSVVYKAEDFDSASGLNSKDNEFGESGTVTDGAELLERNVTNRDANDDDGKGSDQQDELPTSEEKESDQNKVQDGQNAQRMSRRTLDEKVKEMKDQVIRAKAYLNFLPANSTSHFVKELKLRIKDIERAASQSTRDLRLSRSTLQKMRAMESTLSKASRLYPDCSAMVKKLRAMTYNMEEQVRTQRNQEIFLKELGGRTIPKGLHCLSMKLTAEYFALKPEEQEFPNKNKLSQQNLYHFAVFSDNILACSVVVNATVSTAKEPEKIVFHIVTDSINFPAMSMWFLLNPPGKATIHIESIDNFKWLSSFSSRYNTTLQKDGSYDPRYSSALNHLRFYLPDVFPLLKKIILLDHDIVVRRDLTRLWTIDMRGKVIGAVETCDVEKPSFRSMDMLVNFSDPVVAKRFDENSCTWAFGMNVFDLKEWRRRDITGIYHKYLHLGNTRPLFKAGSLPIGWMTFYKQIFALEPRWHVLGLGSDPGVKLVDIEQAAVIHYDGVLKPWLDIGLDKYKSYWKKHVNYDHPFLQQCNIQE